MKTPSNIEDAKLILEHLRWRGVKIIKITNQANNIGKSCDVILAEVLQKIESTKE